MTEVYAFRHVFFEHLGSIEPALESRGLAGQVFGRWADMLAARTPGSK